MKKQEKGQSIIEVIIALSVVVLAVLALVMVTTASIHNSTFARNQSLATKHAQDWIEEVRGLRDSDKEAFFANDGAPCDKAESLPLFELERECSLVAGEERMQVLVSVTWEDAKGEHLTELFTELTKW